MAQDVEEISLRVPDSRSGDRIDRVLAGLVADMSRARLQTLIRDGQVSVGGRTIVEPRYRVNAGDLVHLRIPPTQPAILQPEPIALEIVHEDADLIVISKPAGLTVHPGAGTPSGTLVNALLHHCAGSLSGIGGIERPGIVHRLDKDTSGLMVVAKTDAAHRHLSAQFADHGRTGDLERGYLAIIWGAPERRRGTIDAPLARSPQNPEKMAVRRGGREAITHFEVLDTYSDPEGRPLASLIECRLETGRTHQIRVHLAHIGHPLLGDPVYGGGFRSKERLMSERQRQALAGLGRQALHAYLLALRHPSRDEILRFESDLPGEMRSLVDALTET
ncbi:ribosomal large subunit pseudouridine synthase D [Tepidamorphus gemmatus]|uniref:Pseudouridine synthase n=1 Tax=Tepidamorphus gemmatus TaxID=747076 RepID=A0A4R3MHZ5_9HYPH|nr:RluA family pseudouridine synthase [Tepidamorphus gemmatus]TCT13397.1 ribosomal large subunit pseudouridine synthase D [Tepidamorphus gemmatus]